LTQVRTGFLGYQLPVRSTGTHLLTSSQDRFPGYQHSPPQWSDSDETIGNGNSKSQTNETQPAIRTNRALGDPNIPAISTSFYLVNTTLATCIGYSSRYETVLKQWLALSEADRATMSIKFVTRFNHVYSDPTVVQPKPDHANIPSDTAHRPSVWLVFFWIFVSGLMLMLVEKTCRPKKQYKEKGSDGDPNDKLLTLELLEEDEKSTTDSASSSTRNRRIRTDSASNNSNHMSVDSVDSSDSSDSGDCSENSESSHYNNHHDQTYCINDFINPIQYNKTTKVETTVYL
jgi:hypothetical protein